MSVQGQSRFWLPEKFSPSYKNLADRLYAVLVLNQPIEDKSLLLKLCKNASVFAVADGGANRIYDLGLCEAEEYLVFHKVRRNASEKLETTGNASSAICGDFDSVRPEVLRYYRQKGVTLIHNSDQYSTDMMKSMKWILKTHNLIDNSQSASKKIPNFTEPQLDIAVFGSLGGRADQAFSQIHHLYVMTDELSEHSTGDLYLITAESVMFVLAKGLNRIRTPVGPGFFTENIGIIPIGRPAVVTTRGLEWDVQDWHTEFGTQISTSNHIKKDFVDVQTTERVLFTIEFDPCEAG
ncbi:hypothetical protein MMC21_006102 [Puttea exsequens]|nr:hypothetical protein [Puttea exsequens]